MNRHLALICLLGGLFVDTAPLSALDLETGSRLRVESTALLLRRDGMEGLRTLPELRRLTGPNTYLTSAAVAPWDSRRIVVSTTFHGLYESRDAGETWQELGRSAPFDAIYMGNGFFDDIAAVAFDPEDRALLWIERAQGGRVEALRRGGATTATESGTLSEERGRLALAAAVRAAEPDTVVADAARRARLEAASGHVSFYLNPFQVTPERLDEHLAFAAEHGFTAIVVDFKDDNGRLTYDSSLELPRRVGAVRAVFDAERVIRRIQQEGLYLIARVVVFKDQALYGYDGNRYALWDSVTDRPWGVFREERDDSGASIARRQVEYWVDPFSEEVWGYNIAIARELEQLGVDEIQFDYIRTPADGRTRDIVYRFKAQSPAMQNEDVYVDDRVEALSMFLERARDSIEIPIGIDVFGFNGWYRMSYLGQDIAMLAPHVDVISPMFYPSHFPRDFRRDLPYLEWAEYIYRDGVARARRITRDAVIIRPYIQAFLIGGELQFEEPTYTDYLKRQIRGSLDAGASGFTLWNFSGRYYMVSRGLP